MIKNKIRIWTAILFFLFSTACGYRFVGSGNLPEGVETINIKIFENRTSETGLGNTMTNFIINEFTKKNKGALTDMARADAVLSGAVRSISEKEIIKTSAERRITIVLDVVLTRSDGRIVRTLKGISDDKDYDKAADDWESEKSRVIDELAESLAEDVYNRLTDDF